ncbi:hypothetical protein LTS18_004156 [Coniosporium uncinatum]|uniref:Uncharacterized protein n=1 Tax=Coniosporium uncinatum TaxID=93489 RepID=A0ACC3DSJ6_9PEZI|nr:hypothetical protein LTS18_004156 [Coniosporium uncinatum]
MKESEESQVDNAVDMNDSTSRGVDIVRMGSVVLRKGRGLWAASARDDEEGLTSVKQPPINVPPEDHAKPTNPTSALDSLPTQLESPPFGNDFVPMPPREYVDSDKVRPAPHSTLAASIPNEADFVDINNITNESTRPTNQQLLTSKPVAPRNTKPTSSTANLRAVRCQPAALQPSTSDFSMASSPKASHHFTTSAPTKAKTTARKSNVKSKDKKPSEPATKKPCGWPRKHPQVEAVPIASPKRFKTKLSDKPLSPKRPPSPPSRQTKAAAEEWQSIDEIQDLEPDVTPSPPKRYFSPSKHRSNPNLQLA